MHSAIVRITPPEQKSEVVLVRGGFGSEAAWDIYLGVALKKVGGLCAK